MSAALNNLMPEWCVLGWYVLISPTLITLVELDVAQVCDFVDFSSALSFRKFAVFCVFFFFCGHFINEGEEVLANG